MDKQYTEQELAEIFAPRRAMEAIDRKEFLLVETANPEAGCTGCHFAGKDCPREFSIKGWDCNPESSEGFANAVFIKRASIKGAIIKLAV